LQRSKFSSCWWLLASVLTKEIAVTSCPSTACGAAHPGWVAGARVCTGIGQGPIPMQAGGPLLGGADTLVGQWAGVAATGRRL